MDDGGVMEKEYKLCEDVRSIQSAEQSVSITEVASAARSTSR